MKSLPYGNLERSDLIHEGIATVYVRTTGLGPLPSAPERSDLIHEGIATRQKLAVLALFCYFWERSDLIHEGIATFSFLKIHWS